MSDDKKMPSPAERPDLYDDYDCRPGNPVLGEAYTDAVLPEHVKKKIAERKAAHR